MHPNPSLVEGTVQDAIAALTARYAQVRDGGSRLSKQAMDKTAFLGAIGSALSDPTVKGSLLGAGLGGLAGFGSAALGPPDEEGRPKNKLKSALTGAALGGGLGLGGGLAARGLSAREPAGTFDLDGKRMRLKSGITLTPDIADRLRQLDEGRKPHSVFSRIPYGTLGGMGLAIPGWEMFNHVQPGKQMEALLDKNHNPSGKFAPSKKLITALRQSGYNTVPKSVTEGGKQLSFRHSDLARIMEMAGHKSRHPLVLKGTGANLARSAGKYGLIAAPMALGENWLHNKFDEGLANRRYHNLLSQYAEPAGE